jgi:hypothetical protein
MLTPLVPLWNRYILTPDFSFKRGREFEREGIKG